MVIDVLPVLTQNSCKSIDAICVDKSRIVTSVVSVMIIGAVMLPGSLSGKTGHVHHHGQGTLDIATEGQNLRADLVLPAHDVLGFEHAARTSQEKRHVQDAQAKLIGGWGELLSLSGSLGCQWKVREQYFPGGDDQKKASSQPQGQGSGHQDVRVVAQAQCKQPIKSGRLSLRGLFKSFPKLRSIRAQYLDAKEQRGLVLTEQSPDLIFSGSK